MIAFSGNPLDRASDRRTDAAFLSAKRHDPASRILPVRASMPLVRANESGSLTAAFVSPADIAAPADAACVFLGLEEGFAHFALDANALAEDAFAGLGEFRELRSAGPLLPARDLAILGQAKAMIDWHQRHGFCANCGASTRIADGGYKRICPSCSAEHFPRTDPVVIMLVTHGEQCLLGRNRRFPPRRYSALAGFVEPGETIEEAVAREVFEEAGVRVVNVRYHASQPWPFPSALMIGCYAEAQSRDIRADGLEIEDARWLTREEVRAGFAGEGEIELPPSFAIAHRLIRDWLGS